MKKSIILSAFVLGAIAANAQTALQGTKFTDNWSMELKAGGITPLTHSAFFENMRPAFGVGFAKQLTPVFGLGFQGMGYVNTGNSRTAFDASDVSLLGKVNLMNLLGGYTGRPRTFEIEAMTGIGWLHYYQNGSGDSDSWSTRMGLNLNFNLGESKAWTIGLKPAIVYDMTGDYPHSKAGYNVNNASLELTAGLTYHFGGSNGEHHFTRVRVYDRAEVEGLNADINDLRMTVADQEGMLNEATHRIGMLQQELEECRSREIPVAVETVVKNNRIPESIVTFRQGKSVVDVSQQPNVERVASYLNKHLAAKVIIKGYASPEGNASFNEKLAQDRADAVRNILVKKYKIDPARITSQGMGVGDMFSEPDWNRVSICTIDEAM